MSEPKDIGKFPLTSEELVAVGLPSDLTPPQGSSQALILKELLDDLVAEAQRIEDKRRAIHFRILTINALLAERVKAQQVAEFKRPA